MLVLGVSCLQKGLALLLQKALKLRVVHLQTMADLFQLSQEYDAIYIYR